MKKVISFFVFLLSLTPALADDKDAGFVPMFNGKDLTGWVNVNCHPDTFFVKDGMVITTGKPTGYLRTEKQYENFIADFEWMHVPPKPGAVGNSGFFVWADPIPAIGTGYTRGIEVQVLVNLTYKNKKGEITATSQGDLFSIWGATCVPDRPHPEGWARCLPNGEYCKGEGEWNHYRVEANDGRITLEVNGHVVSGVSKCNPRKGYLALESEGSECRFRNLKIKELPSTNPKPEEIADVDKGFKNLYFGDLTGWKADEETKKHWQPKDWMLHYDGQGKEFRSEREFGDGEFIIDFKFPQKKGQNPTAVTFIIRDGPDGITLKMTSDGKAEIVGGKISLRHEPDLDYAGKWNRLKVVIQRAKVQVFVNGRNLSGDLKVAPLPEKSALIVQPEGPMDFANIFVRESKNE
ncbi:MAG TPA: family 16 glycoside hydrolase [Gemmataceae bacterium]|nr:family 16 glycoside hydrolase [Gemmataceae bacterium]